MEKKLRTKKTWSISFIFTLFILMVYGVKFFSANYVFDTGVINLFENERDIVFGLPLTFNLPIVISRFWDLFFIFFVTLFIIKIIYYIKDLQSGNDYLVGGLVYSLIAGFAIGGLSSFVVGLPLGIIFGIEVATFLGLLFGLISGFIFGPGVSFIFSFEAGVAAGLISMLSFILAFGLIVGVTIGLILGFTMFIGAATGRCLKYLFFREWQFS